MLMHNKEKTRELDLEETVTQAPKTSRSNREFELYPNTRDFFYLILSKPNTYKEN